MKTICISVSDSRRAETERHFSERGVDAQFFRGINAPKLGIDGTLVYEVDAPGSGYKIGDKITGCWLSHRALWAACLLLPDESFLILEDDARFPEDWRTRFDQAVSDAGDFNVLFIGSCCTLDKPRNRVAGSVYDVKWPLCLHGYIVKRKVLPVFITTQDEARCYAPIDISLVFHTFPKLERVYTVLPRIVDQHATDFPD